jgi:hypothetical protein
MKKPPVNVGFIIQLVVIFLFMAIGVGLLVFGFMVYFQRGGFPVHTVVGLVLLGVGVMWCILRRVVGRGG